MKKQNEKEEHGQKVAVVTGSSSGIGYATALELARSGYFTFATMRNPAKGADLIKAAEKENLPIRIERLDVTDIDSIKEFFTKTKRIDVLVNNAGYVAFGSLEDLSIEEIQDQLDTNLLGTIRVTQQALPIMRAQKGGIIVNVSSMSGRFGVPGMSAYVATKFAMEGLTESLASEVEPFGIEMALIEPGPVRTNAIDNRVIGQKALREDSPYSDMLKNLNSSVGALWERASTSDQVAKIILQAVTSPKSKLRYPVGQDAAIWHEKKDSMTDEQFQTYIRNSFASVAPAQKS